MAAELENTYNDLTPAEKEFFTRMQMYLQTKVYFYGSINRPDYYSGNSDIDVFIFSNNIPSTLSRLEQFLHISSNEIEKIFRVIDKHEPVLGYKISYTKKGTKNTNATLPSVTADPHMTNGYSEANASPYSASPSERPFSVEISVYREKDKVHVFKEQRQVMLPFYFTIALMMIKWMYYDLGIISKKHYQYWKSLILTKTRYFTVNHYQRKIH